MIKAWYMQQPFLRLRDQLSDKDLHKLKRFYTQQLALSQELLEAKQLGTCKITTSVGSLSLDEYLLTEGEANCILSSDASKEMFL